MNHMNQLLKKQKLKNDFLIYYETKHNIETKHNNKSSSSGISVNNNENDMVIGRMSFGPQSNIESSLLSKSMTDIDNVALSWTTQPSSTMKPYQNQKNYKHQHENNNNNNNNNNNQDSDTRTKSSNPKQQSYNNSSSYKDYLHNSSGLEEYKDSCDTNDKKGKLSYTIGKNVVNFKEEKDYVVNSNYNNNNNTTHNNNNSNSNKNNHCVIL